MIKIAILLLTLAVSLVAIGCDMASEVDYESAELESAGHVSVEPSTYTVTIDDVTPEQLSRLEAVLNQVWLGSYVTAGWNDDAGYPVFDGIFGQSALSPFIDGQTQVEAQTKLFPAYCDRFYNP